MDRRDRRRQQREGKVKALLQQLKAERAVSEEEEAWSLWYASFSDLKDLTLPKLKLRLQEHQEGHEKRQRRAVSDARERPPPPKWKRSKKRQRRESREQRLLARYSGSKLAALSFLDVVEAGHFSRAYPLLSAKHWGQSLRALIISWGKNKLRDSYPSEGEREQEEERIFELLEERFNRDLEQKHLEQLLRIFEKKLDNLKSSRKKELLLRSEKESFKEFYNEKIAPAWADCLERYGEICAENGIDLWNIEDRYSQKLRELLKPPKRGESFQDKQAELKPLLNGLEEEIIEQVKEERERRRLVSTYDEHSDLASCFPKARKIFRRLEFFCGPTNSGKTYAALQALKDSKSGVYLAPLRLLALEVQQSLIAWGTPCSMITGEEQDHIEGAEFVSSTIEMLNFNRVVETAVIDEIQLLGDDRRGWAWTNALLGVAAERVIFTGSPNALPLLKKLADYLGEPLKVRHFKRFQPLNIHKMHHSLGAGKLKSGTAIVCFSRHDVLTLKQHIEQEMKLPVSVVYGGLSPEVRRIEAQRFRDRQSKILVATDAIGMGLNLPIRELLFWKTYKYYDHQEHELRASEVQQIAGRAGRFGMEEEGYIGAFSGSDLRFLQRKYPAELPDLAPPCFVQPLPFHLEMISKFLNTEELVPILCFFQQKIWFSIELFKANITDEMLDLAARLAPLTSEASLLNKYIFASAPVSMRAPQVVQAHLSFARGALAGGACFPESLKEKGFEGLAKSSNELYEAEDSVQIATLYQWLAYRFPDQFLEMEEAQSCRQSANDYILRSLRAGSVLRRCSRCNKELPLGFKHRHCDDCHYSSRYA